MMDLVLDIGNTRSKLALVSDGQLTPQTPVPNPHLLTTLDQLLVERAPGRVALAAVARAELQAEVTSHLSAKGWQVRQLETQTAAFGLRNSYADVTRMGVDRWLAMVGAWRQVQSALVVIDIGTAMTLDVVAEDGRHQGGWILPGYQLMLDSITGQTARVGVDTIQAPAFRLGQDTADCLQQGCRAALMGAVELGLSLARQQLSAEPTLFLTGGGMDELPPERIAELNGGRTIRAPLLVLEGMAAFLT